MAGTVAYLAPEVIRGEEPTPASDLYGLGCVLFECLAGAVPYPGRSAATVIFGHLEQPPPALPELPALDPVIARALAKDPAERYGSRGGAHRRGAGCARHAAARASEPARRGRPARRCGGRDRRAVAGAGHRGWPQPGPTPPR